MPRNLKRDEIERRARARRESALRWIDLGPGHQREAAAGPTSMAVKSRDPETEQMIAEFKQQKKDQA